MKKFWAEFREFAMKGSMIDLAIGVIVGGAFSTVVSSLVKDVITPLLSIVIGRISISDLSAVIPGILGSKSITISYGIFLQNLLNFFIIALFIFLIIRSINRIREKLPKLNGEEEEKTQATLTKTEELLSEIRDMMKEKQD